MVYKSGLYFSKALKENIDYCIERIKLNKAALIIIEGGVGEGKTTLLVHVLDYINSQHNLPEVDLKKPTQYAMGGSDFMKKLRECYEKKLPCIGYDEAGDFSKRGSLTNFNAMLNRTFDTFRAFKCIVVLSLPNFNVLDQQIFDNKIPRLMLTLRNRTANQGDFKGYSLYRMLLLKAKMKQYKLKEYAYNKVQGNFHGHFQDLPKERSKLLDKLSTKNKTEILKRSEIKIAGLMSYPELATKLGKVTGTIQNAVSNLKIKPARRVRGVCFFDDNALNQLAEHFVYTSDYDSMKEKQNEKQKA